MFTWVCLNYVVWKCVHASVCVCVNVCLCVSARGDLEVVGYFSCNGVGLSGRKAKGKNPLETCCVGTESHGYISPLSISSALLSGQTIDCVCVS